ncbi:hydroxymethylglutaryl-CoA reductase, degradative [Enterococcus sp. AZ194]|uniref:hydroxymethylglutaryl-CoA reductase, degradative n=1 Tax=Enterococcus sp. AZ194 TaxID=2774629 RepID=UPI003F1EFC23
MKEVVIIDATRTPIGKYRGGLSSLSAVELGKTVVETILDRNSEVKDEIKQVIFGHVLQAGVGQNTARQITVAAGLPVSVPAMTVNEVCGSGLKSVILARQLIQVGEAEVVLAGGTENMSQAPMIQHYQPETKDYAPGISSMVLDGLTDAFSQTHMGITAENVAEKYQISREQQDQFAVQSQKRAAAAIEAGRFVEEITPVTLPSGDVFTQDEGVRGNSTVEVLGTLRAAFKEGGTVTAGNSSTVNDGAAAVLLASKEYAKKENVSYLAVIKDYTEVGVDPAYMGFAPYDAIKALLEKNQLTVDDIDLFEINEAFAATSVAAARKLNLPDDKVNIYGGGISLGHPIGASGARILTTLAYALKAQKKKRGIVSLCIGGGLGLAVLIEREEPFDSTNEKKKFYQLSREERLEQLYKDKQITKEQLMLLQEAVSLPEGLGDNLIENQISEVSTPLGIAQNFVINGKERLIPMATEEPSVIAAASNAAKIIKQAGGFKATVHERLMRGQIVFSAVVDPQKLQEVLLEKKAEIFSLATESYPSIVKRGGGIRQIKTRTFTENQEIFVSLDVLVDVKDAMGANIVNTILEGIATGLREWFPKEEILFSILSNYATESLATSLCEIPVNQLGKGKISGEAVAKRIVEAATYAKLDSYRAVTHNKGIMNGIDAIILATGNDTRAVAAASHAYAAKNGRYEGLTDWTLSSDGQTLVGELTIPMAVASVGGASSVLPKAKFALDLLAVNSAVELAEIVVSVGLAQNLAAVRALVTEGIQKGHMSLQVRSLAMSVGASGQEIGLVVEALKEKGQLNKTNAEEALKNIRQKTNN